MHGAPCGQGIGERPSSRHVSGPVRLRRYRGGPALKPTLPTLPSLSSLSLWCLSGPKSRWLEHARIEARLTRRPMGGHCPKLLGPAVSDASSAGSCQLKSALLCYSAAQQRGTFCETLPLGCPSAAPLLGSKTREVQHWSMP